MIDGPASGRVKEKYVKNHTNAYSAWTDSDEGLEFFHHVEWCTPTREIDVRVRKNRFGDVQVFNGVYDENGQVLMEEFFADSELRTIDSAMAWGKSRTRSVAGVPQD